MRKSVVIVSILTFTAMLIWWLSTNPTKDFEASVPGMDNNGNVSEEIQTVKIGEFFKQIETTESTLTGTWPRFRGSDYSNISKSKIKTIDKFPADGPKVVWQTELGEGHAGAAIYKGLAYILDYNEEERADMLRCYDLKTGKEQWKRWYKVDMKRNHGLSRTVPAVTEDYILTIGPKCHVMCVDRKTGDFLWGLDIAKEYGSEIPLWYTGQCPLIDDGVAVIATGGKALMVGIDCKTGKKLWETPNPDNWKMSHASIIPFTFEGEKMYVYPAVGGLCGVGAIDDNLGKILWKTNAWNHAVVAPSPVCMPDGKIFLTAGYGAGSMVCQLKKENDTYTINVLQEYKPRDGLACEQQTPIYYNSHLFGILPKDAGSLRNQFVCVDPKDCTKTVWTSGKTNRFGLGPYIIADNKFYLLNDDGTLFIIDASTKRYTQFDKFKLMEGHDAWAPLAVVDGFMVLRDSKTLMCIKIGNE